MQQSGGGVDGHRPGDKVRVRAGPDAGQRGLICDLCPTHVVIGLDDGRTVELPDDAVTNYSLAARRAWRVMPKRAGRPRLEEPRKKLVSVRLDMAVWRDMRRAAEFGLIGSRDAAIN